MTGHGVPLYGPPGPITVYTEWQAAILQPVSYVAVYRVYRSISRIFTVGVGVCEIRNGRAYVFCKYTQKCTKLDSAVKADLICLIQKSDSVRVVERQKYMCVLVDLNLKMKWANWEYTFDYIMNNSRRASTQPRNPIFVFND